MASEHQLTQVSQLELNKIWVLNQLVCQGTVEFDKPSVIPEHQVFYWKGTCRLKINKQRKLKKKSTFFFFVPTQVIKRVYYTTGILETLRRVFSQYFNTKKGQFEISEPLCVTNYHFKASFNFEFELVISTIIPTLQAEFGGVSVRGYQEEGLPTADISLLRLRQCVEQGQTGDLMQIFVHIADQRYVSKKSRDVRKHVLKFMRADKRKSISTVKTRVTLITSFITQDLFRICHTIQNFDHERHQQNE